MKPYKNKKNNILETRTAGMSPSKLDYLYFHLVLVIVIEKNVYVSEVIYTICAKEYTNNLI